MPRTVLKRKTRKKILSPKGKGKSYVPAKTRSSTRMLCLTHPVPTPYTPPILTHPSHYHAALRINTGAFISEITSSGIIIDVTGKTIPRINNLYYANGKWWSSHWAGTVIGPEIPSEGIDVTPPPVFRVGSIYPWAEKQGDTFLPHQRDRQVWAKIVAIEGDHFITRNEENGTCSTCLLSGQLSAGSPYWHMYSLDDPRLTPPVPPAPPVPVESTSYFAIGYEGGQLFPSAPFGDAAPAVASLGPNCSKYLPFKVTAKSDGTLVLVTL